MLFSRTSQYAIQALVYCSMQDADVPFLGRDIAAGLGIPGHYLSKILQQLRHGGILQSYRGRQGGFCLCQKPEQISLIQIMHITEGPAFAEDCVLGLKECSDETACPMHHENWKPIRCRITAMLEEQTLCTLAEAVKTGKYRLSDLPAAAMTAHVTAPDGV
jgi:Rrf2 family protein